MHVHFGNETSCIFGEDLFCFVFFSKKVNNIHILSAFFCLLTVKQQKPLAFYHCIPLRHTQGVLCSVFSVFCPLHTCMWLQNGWEGKCLPDRIVLVQNEHNCLHSCLLLCECSSGGVSLTSSNDSGFLHLNRFFCDWWVQAHVSHFHQWHHFLRCAKFG